MNYFDWLLMIIAPDYRQRSFHIKLLLALFSKEFQWVIKRDQNRALDGLELRGVFKRETGDYPDIFGECTCLELFVSMAIRCENELMYDYDDDAEDHTDRWFWMMVNNLGLDYYDDDHFNPDAVDKILDNFMDRNYGRNFEYCPFPVTVFVADFDKMELAYQMNYYIRENFY